MIKDRIEKLSSAIYRVTDFFYDSEALKWELRSATIRILSDIESCPLESIDRILSLLKVATSVELISDTNAGILIREFSNLRTMLEGSRVPQVLELSTLEETPSLPEVKSEDRKVEKQLKMAPNNNTDNNRKTLILEFLRSNNEATISDICSVVTNCSSKTVQRELVSMVSDGLIKKKGEKRWSRYFI